jgi:hypothetical protein
MRLRYAKNIFLPAALLIVIMMLFAVTLLPQKASSQASSVAITGYAWSDSFGWISLNCLTGGPGGSNVCALYNYGLSVDNTGLLSGYAWSDNVGWISANSSDLVGCPIAPCTANLSATALTGWLKILSGGTPQSGGWSGWISLDTKPGDVITYGVTYSSGNFGACSGGTSCAWDGDSTLTKGAGWVDFSLAHATVGACAASTVYTCSGTQTIVQTVTNASCSQTITNTACVAPQFCSPGQPTCLTPAPGGFPSGTATGNLTIKPTIVAKNGTAMVSWGIINVAPGSCSLTGSDGTSWTGDFSATSTCPTKSSGACVTNPITQQTIFTLACTDFNGRSFTQSATINLLPDYQER